MAQTLQPVRTGRRRWPEGVDVKVWHRYCGSEFGIEEVQALLDVLQQEFLTNGPQTLAFQEEFADFCGVPHAFDVILGSQLGLGASHALLDDGLRTASVVASEPTECLALTRWDFLSALRKTDVEMSIIILQELAKRFRRALDSL